MASGAAAHTITLFETTSSKMEKGWDSHNTWRATNEAGRFADVTLLDPCMHIHLSESRPLIVNRHGFVITTASGSKQGFC